MPRYVYSCEECGLIYQRTHSIKEKLTDCEECHAIGALKRIPSMPLILSKNQDKQKRQVGSLVKEYIEDAKGDLKEEKGELISQVYEDD